MDGEGGFTSDFNGTHGGIELIGFWVVSDCAMVVRGVNKGRADAKLSDHGHSSCDFRTIVIGNDCVDAFLTDCNNGR